MSRQNKTKVKAHTQSERRLSDAPQSRTAAHLGLLPAASLASPTSVCVCARVRACGAGGGPRRSSSGISRRPRCPCRCGPCATPRARPWPGTWSPAADRRGALCKRCIDRFLFVCVVCTLPPTGAGNRLSDLSTVLLRADRAITRSVRIIHQNDV